MSSKLLPLDDERPAERMVWRTVAHGSSGSQSSAGAAARGAFSPVGGNDSSIERRLEEARAAGLRAGEAAGLARASAELQPVMQRLAQAIQDLAVFRPRLRREAEGDLVRLAVAMARRILRREIALDPEAMHGLILGALEKLQSQEISRVRVHPAHASLLNSCLQQMGSPNVEIVPDPSREPGSVLFETERGNLDASVESQLREIERGLADRLDHRR